MLNLKTENDAEVVMSKFKERHYKELAKEKGIEAEPPAVGMDVESSEDIERVIKVQKRWRERQKNVFFRVKPHEDQEILKYIIGNTKVYQSRDAEKKKQLKNALDKGEWNDPIFKDITLTQIAMGLFSDDKIDVQQFYTVLQYDQTVKDFPLVQASKILDEDGEFTEEAKKLLLPAIFQKIKIGLGHRKMPEDIKNFEKDLKFLIQTLPKSEQMFYTTTLGPLSGKSTDEALGLVEVGLGVQAAIPEQELFLHLTTGLKDAIGLAEFGLNYAPTLLRLGELLKEDIEFGILEGFRVGIVYYEGTRFPLTVHKYKFATPTEITVHDDYHAKVLSSIPPQFRNALKELVILTRKNMPFMWSLEIWDWTDCDYNYFHNLPEIERNLDKYSERESTELFCKMLKYGNGTTLMDVSKGGSLTVDGNLTLPGIITFIDMIKDPDKWKKSFKIFPEHLIEPFKQYYEVINSIYPTIQNDDFIIQALKINIYLDLQKRYPDTYQTQYDTINKLINTHKNKLTSEISPSRRTRSSDLVKSKPALLNTINFTMKKHEEKYPGFSLFEIIKPEKKDAETLSKNLEDSISNRDNLINNLAKDYKFYEAYVEEHNKFLDYLSLSYINENVKYLEKGKDIYLKLLMSDSYFTSSEKMYVHLYDAYKNLNKHDIFFQEMLSFVSKKEISIANSLYTTILNRIEENYRISKSPNDINEYKKSLIAIIKNESQSENHSGEEKHASITNIINHITTTKNIPLSLEEQITLLEELIIDLEHTDSDYIHLVIIELNAKYDELIKNKIKQDFVKNLFGENGIIENVIMNWLGDDAWVNEEGQKVPRKNLISFVKNIATSLAEKWVIDRDFTDSDFNKLFAKFNNSFKQKMKQFFSDEFITAHGKNDVLTEKYIQEIFTARNNVQLLTKKESNTKQHLQHTISLIEKSSTLPDDYFEFSILDLYRNLSLYLDLDKNNKDNKILSKMLEKIEQTIVELRSTKKDYRLFRSLILLAEINFEVYSLNKTDISNLEKAEDCLLESYKLLFSNQTDQNFLGKKDQIQLDLIKIYNELQSKANPEQILMSISKLEKVGGVWKYLQLHKLAFSLYEKTNDIKYLHHQLEYINAAIDSKRLSPSDLKLLHLARDQSTNVIKSLNP